MKRAIAMALIASTLMAGLAAGQPAHKAKGGDVAPSADTSRSMDAPYLAVPVVRGGVLVNYLFVSVRFEIAPGVDLWRTRAQAHLVRDALVRASYANQLASADDINVLDGARAIQVFRAAAAQVLGQSALGQVSIISSQSSQGAPS